MILEIAMAEPAFDAFAWEEVAALWDDGDFGGVHDWLGLRWNCLIQSRPAGQADPDARFVQGLAFAALAFHFTCNRRQDGAALLADDALSVLSDFLPTHRDVQVGPILETLNALRPLLNGLEREAECPMQPFVVNKLVYRMADP